MNGTGKRQLCECYEDSAQVQWDKACVILPVQHEPIVVYQRNLGETDYHHLIPLNTCKY